MDKMWQNAYSICILKTNHTDHNYLDFKVGWFLDPWGGYLQPSLEQAKQPLATLL
jgi:hypothetical protein